MKPNMELYGTSKLVQRTVSGARTPSAPDSLRGNRKLSRQLTDLKRSMARALGYSVAGNAQMLKSALNEAEALAWQTSYPHLVFPVLAEEKAHAVGRWAARQRSVLRASRETVLTA